MHLRRILELLEFGQSSNGECNWMRRRFSLKRNEDDEILSWGLKTIRRIVYTRVPKSWEGFTACCIERREEKDTNNSKSAKFQ